MQYTIRKKLVGGERLHYKCGSCGGDLESPLDDAGRTDVCPLCGHRFKVPGEEELQKRHAQETKRQAQAQREAQLQAAEAEKRRVEAIRTKAERKLAQNMAQAGVAYEGKLSFEGSWTPTVQLLENEKVLEVIEAGPRDLGLIGWALGHKRKLLLTTHRVIKFEKLSVDCRLDVLWLAKVTCVSVGQYLNAAMASIAILLLLAIFPVLAGMSDASGSARSAVVLIMVGLAAGLLVFCRRKVMIVSTGADKAGLVLTRLGGEESSRLVNKLFAMLQSCGSR